MKYYIRSGKLYAADNSRTSPSLCSIVSPFYSPEKTVAGQDGAVLFTTDLAQDKSRKYPEGRSYLIKSPEGAIKGRGYLQYADGQSSQSVCRMPRINRVAMDVKGTIYTLKMQNSQNYVLSAGDRRVLEIVHNQEAGGWNVESAEEVSPDFIMVFYIFSRYLDKENEFIVV